MTYAPRIKKNTVLRALYIAFKMSYFAMKDKEIQLPPFFIIGHTRGGKSYGSESKITVEIHRITCDIRYSSLSDVLPLLKSMGFSPDMTGEIFQPKCIIIEVYGCLL